MSKSSAESTQDLFKMGNLLLIFLTFLTGTPLPFHKY